MKKQRANFATRTSERWQPPAFLPVRSPRDRALAAARRVLDLQAASIWRDLTHQLVDARGDVLDVGAGAQPYRRLLPPGTRYQALDIDEALERFGYAMPDTTYFDGGAWPFTDASVDLVLATETLEHVPTPKAFLAEARRVLRADGRIVLTVPFSARWHYVPYDYWRFTPSSLLALLHEAGFRDVVVHARGDELTVACAKLMALVLAPLLPHERPSRAARAVAFLFTPLLLPLAALGHLSLRSGGDDCLGWTVTAGVA